MCWANIKELIFQERKFLDPAAVMDFPQESAFETQQSALLASYLNTKAEVDAAISTFAQTLEWPPLTPLEKFFVAGRLDFAWEIASILNTSHEGETLITYPSPEKCTTAELLEWLLIEIWPYGCGRFLQAQRWVSESFVPQSREALVEHEAAKHTSCVA
jgi:hypothetical protein